MVDFVVRFVGDLGNLAAFNSTIRNSMLSNSQMMNQASLAIASRGVGENVAAGPGSSAGLYMTNAKSSIDSFNNSLRQSGTIMRQFISGYTTEVNALGKAQVKPLFGQAYHADFNLAIADAQNYARAIAKLAPLDSLALGQQQSLMMRSASRQNLASDINTFVAQERAQTKAMTSMIKGRDAGPLYSDAFLVSQAADLERRVRASLTPAQLASMGGVVPGLTGYVPPTITRAYDPLGASSATGEKRGEMTAGSLTTANIAMMRSSAGISLGEHLGTLFNESHEADVRATEDAIRRVEATPAARYLRANAMMAALSPEGRIGTNATNLLEKYPDIRRDLIQKSGLGGGAKYGTPQFFENSQSQGFQVGKYTKDMERGLLQVRGSLMDANGVMNDFTYSIDKNGKAINSWGRSLSGSRGFLNQTGRDFVKVIEWTIATTAVFGALGVAISGLSKINDLNSDLQRLAITAKLTKSETSEMFKGLAQVAYQTATPITELVKASDDMALASRKANQTTDEWRESILKLATAVGILTNISGMDTVQATELLTAAMKQLDLTSEQSLVLLNKVAAAAGGQANSITDIVQSLGTLSEAGLEAGMTVEQQIGAVQVISQVTGKSADAVATAFKNLFGSIDSAGSIKKLREFGIEVRDSGTGELKPFLQIYQEIQKAIETGIIPEGRIKEVVKAIAGGPRRAPDASALLSNINRVAEVTAIANNASNEALIANALVLDTNKAKIIQLQNAWDVSMFEKLSKVIEDLTTTLVEFGTFATQLFGNIPSELVQIIVQAGILITAFTLMSKILGVLGANRFFSNLTGGIRSATSAIGGLVSPAGGGALATGAMAAEQAALRAAAGTDFIAQQANPRMWQLLPLATREAAIQRSVKAMDRQVYRSMEIEGQIRPSEVAPFTTPGRTIPRSVPYVPQYPTNPSLTGVNWGPQGRLTEEEIRIRRGTYFSRPEALQQTIPFRSSSRYMGSGAPLSMDERYSMSRSEFNARMAAIGMPNPQSRFQQSLSRLNTRTGRLGALGLGVAGGAFALGQNTGGADSGVANMGMMAGMGLMMIPSGVSQVAGAGLMAASLALQMFNQHADDAKKKALDLEKGLYDLTQEWKTQQTAITALNESYTTVSTALTEATKGTQQYIDLQNQLGVLTLQKAQAEQAQADNFDKIKESLAALNKEDAAKWGTITGAIRAGGGNLSPDALKAIVPILSQDILSASGKAISFPSDLRLDVSKLSFVGNQGTEGSIFQKGSPLKGLQYGGAQPFDILDLIANPEKVNNLTGKLGKGVNFPVNATTQAVYLGALQAQKEQLGVEKFNAAVDEFWAYAKNANSGLALVMGQIDATKAATETLGMLGVLQGTDLVNAQGRSEAAGRIQSIFGNLPTEEINQFTGRRMTKPGGSQQGVAGLLQSFLLDSEGVPKGAAITPEEAKSIAEAYFSGLSIGNKNLLDFLNEHGQLVGATAGFWKDLGQDIKGVTDDATTGLDSMNDALIAFIHSTEQIGQNWRLEASNSLLNLQAQMQGGGLTPEEVKRNLFQQGQQKALMNAGTKLDDIFAPVNRSAANSAKAVGIFQDAMEKLRIHGFEGLPPTVDAVSGAIWGLVTTLNLSGPQIAKYFLLVAEAMRIAQELASLPIVPSMGEGASQFQEQQYMRSASRRADLAGQLAGVGGQLSNLGGQGKPFTSGSSAAANKPDTGTIYLSDRIRELEKAGQINVAELVKKSYADALKLQSQVPGATKENATDIVVIFNGLKRVLQTKGVAEEYLTKALDENTQQLKIQNESKADTIRRIRVGAGDFSALANVPLNSKSGVSVGSPTGPISINLDINGQLLTPAQFSQLANQIASALKSSLAAGAG